MREESQMSTKDNFVVEETFLVMCEILKKEAGVYNKEIALNIGIDSSLLSRWINRSGKITAYYNNRIYEYFAQPKFEPHNNSLKYKIIHRLKLNSNGRIYQNIISLSYVPLLKYLFFALNKDALEREYRLTYICFEMAKNTLIRRTMNHTRSERQYRVIDNIISKLPASNQKECSEIGISDKDILLIEAFKNETLFKRFLIIFNYNKYDHSENSIESKLEFILTEKNWILCDQYFIITNPYDFFEIAYTSHHLNTSMVSSGIDIENINVTNLTKYVGIIINKTLEIIFEE